MLTGSLSVLGDTWLLEFGHGPCQPETDWDGSVVRKTWILILLGGPSLVLKKSCLHKARL